MDIAKQISTGLAASALIAQVSHLYIFNHTSIKLVLFFFSYQVILFYFLCSKVNGSLWDMTRPLEEDCELKLFKFEDAEGRDTFWHSSAHILGEVTP